MEKGKVYSGFTLNEMRNSHETGSVVHYFHHDKSGADLIFLKNSDKNKAFGIGFKTPPEDSEGVAHIIEHCVLSGSRKFKTREPFMELLKSSMATFLNAMTYADMTIYPVSSMNEDDLHNLMDVYLDAVLFPDIFTRKEIFMQEGWHYDIHNPEDPINYSGVVYNEMKGAYSSAERQVYAQAVKELMPGSTYAWESGGYPYDIPNLTTEKFLNFHKKYYHPSNSMVYLYGDLDIERALKFIDSEYLNKFDDLKESVEIKKAGQLEKESHLEFLYNSDENSDAKKNSYLSYLFNPGTCDNKEDIFLTSLMAEILVNSDSSPIKKALLSKEIGEDIISFDSVDYYLTFGFGAKNTSDSNMKIFKETVDEELSKLVKEGIDRDLLLGALNRFEMSRREAQGTLKGIVYFIMAMKSWRYGNDPMQTLEYDDVFKKLRSEMDNGIFEKFIEDKILGSGRKLTVIHRPSPDVFKKEDEKERERLDAYKKSLSEDELKSLIEENRKLKEFQTQEDSEADKNTIPKLKISEIPAEILEIEEEREEIPGGILLKHPMASSGLSYATFTFSEDHLTEEELPYLTYIAEMLGSTDTEKRGYSELNNEINKHTSGIDFRPVVYKHSKKRGEYTVRLIVSSSVIGGDFKNFLSLLDELINETVFTDRKRMKEILNIVRSNMEMGFDFRGQSLVMSRVKSFFSAGDYINEKVDGIGFYDNLNALIADFDEKADEFTKKLKEVYGKVFLKDKIVVSVTSDGENIDSLSKELKNFTEKLSNKKYPASAIKADLHPEREGIYSGSNVQYVSKGYNLFEAGYSYSGDITVLMSLLSLDYLHNAIRARGGAYGAGISADLTGDVATYSYRDPNLEKTVDVYKNTGKYLREGKFTEDDIKSYIVGSMKSYNPPVAPSEVNGIMISRYLRDVTTEGIERRLKEALKSTREKMMSYADMMDDILNKGYLSVYGGKSKIEASAELFDDIRPLKIKDKTK